MRWSIKGMASMAVLSAIVCACSVTAIRYYRLRITQLAPAHFVSLYNDQIPVKRVDLSLWTGIDESDLMAVAIDCVSVSESGNANLVARSELMDFRAKDVVTVLVFTSGKRRGAFEIEMSIAKSVFSDRGGLFGMRPDDWEEQFTTEALSGKSLGQLRDFICRLAQTTESVGETAGKSRGK